jgi:predicted nucleic acid-binding Zn ribbon protein
VPERPNQGFFFGPRITVSNGQDPTSGDNPVDSVDNAVTVRPTGGANPAISGDPTPRAGVDHSETSASTTESDHPQLHGSDLARAALRAAKEASKAKPSESPVRRRGAGAGSRKRRRWSAAGPDERDPQPRGRRAAPVGPARGGAARPAGGNVFGRWARIVGEDVAVHATPVALEDAVLTVRADSTAWATQLRLLQRQLLAKIAAGVGDGVVKRLKIQGPAAPSWRHGSRHVPGRGPRDTYG